jgi:hypothetical protein
MAVKYRLKSIVFVKKIGREYVLMTRGFGYEVPAGGRLFKTEPWPDIQFRHSKAGTAYRDAERLQQYLDTL